MSAWESAKRYASVARQRGFIASARLARQAVRDRSIARRHYKPATGGAGADCHAILSLAGQRAEDHVSFHAHPPAAHDTKLITYYLPQYHPIAENDAWWGRGFTEWTNVGRGTPQFVGHAQPKLPGELGYYDLRVQEVARRQVELAANYGIHAFCYYYYWFSGKRLLDRPIEDLLADPVRQQPFCLVWANENWTRTWDGLDGQVLMSQRYTDEDQEQFARDLVRFLRDPRYLRVDGKPMFLVYKPLIIPRLPEAVAIWRRVWAEAGIPDVYLVCVQTTGPADPRELGFDAAAEFAPHQYKKEFARQDLAIVNPEFKGKVYDYEAMVEDSLSRPDVPYTLFRCASPGWDNTARRGGRATIFVGASSARFGRWLRGLVADARRRLPSDRRFVFVNAWNEWAEGAYLEPDQRHGYGNLEACRAALEPDSGGAAPATKADVTRAPDHGR
ncbi:MAG: glycosyltransferase WbsX family protein [Thermoplasmatota archaeon]